MLRRLSAFLLLIGLYGVARADDTDEALAILEEGVRLFEQGDFRMARDKFVRARDLVPEKPNPHRWLGLAEAKMGHCELAIPELERFIYLVGENDFRADEAKRVRERCVSDVERNHVGTLVVETMPPLATVLVDGRARGSTPFRGPIAPGIHVLVLEKPGQQVWKKSITVAPRDNVRFDIVLTPGAEGPVPDSRRPLIIVGAAVGAAALVVVIVGLGVGLGLRTTTPEAGPLPPIFAPGSGG